MLVKLQLGLPCADQPCARPGGHRGTEEDFCWIDDSPRPTPGRGNWDQESFPMAKTPGTQGFKAGDRQQAFHSTHLPSYSGDKLFPFLTPCP